MYYFLKKNCPFTESFQVVSVLKVLKLNLMNNHQTNKQKNNRQLAQTFMAKVIVYNGARRERKKNKVSAFFLSMWSLFQRTFPGDGHEKNSVDAILNPGTS